MSDVSEALTVHMVGRDCSLPSDIANVFTRPTHEVRSYRKPSSLSFHKSKLSCSWTSECRAQQSVKLRVVVSNLRTHG